MANKTGAAARDFTIRRSVPEFHLPVTEPRGKTRPSARAGVRPVSAFRRSIVCQNAVGWMSGLGAPRRLQFVANPGDGSCVRKQ